jgi:hypothetical protein
MIAKRMGALAAAGVSLLLVATSFGPAEARRGFGGWHGGSHFSGARIGGRHFSGNFARRGHRLSRGVFIGAPLAYGAYYYGSNYYGDGGCYWLRRRALATGSSYWWNRYEDCIGGGDY